ncbi:hypothetical protein CONPUDRAFT_108277 [Coniophora puteana RWD-64-598 SS2]|uniref:Macrophage erythroblast attacher n=1 Tax=Coniophora puteana (strain RWD-64-598) TaxID=741705 RepID=A0A5M3MHY2_CONPW|nr:uncharacterized protein CONPUDRAFT_108277 [Coniophora puteana RWD-64-598 SS2]EIW78394.1 hypothetical protein CONPUDRAFT_108277 [Coniophora puteana RWD-64-598 SS2]
MGTLGKVNMEGVMLFEQPFVRVPYENYRKVFRVSQRNLERELAFVQTTSNELLKRSKVGEADPEDALKSVEGMIARVENLQRKLSDLQEVSGKPTIEVTRDRLNLVSAVENLPSTSDPEFSRWADVRLDRWLVDWALRNGKEQTARKLAEEKHIERFVDIDLFTDISRTEEALRKHSCTEALAWCSENKAALRKIKSTLEFELRMQEYIELARSRKMEEAMTYSKKHLVPWQETHFKEILQASALLAIPPTTTSSQYRRLYDNSRWTNLIKSFRLAIYSLNSLPTEPLLHLALYAGLASLKLPGCGVEPKNVDCPTCDPHVNVLAKDVPFSHHTNSTIVCRINGKIMDEDNPPMAFPNGQVYSRDSLEEMASKKNGKVICPHTGYTCELSALKKVFIS